MSIHLNTTSPGGEPGAPMPSAQETPGQKNQKNVLAIVALITAIVGFVFACLPGALIVGWVLLPIAFVLAIISLFMKGRKGLGIAALIVSVVGTIAGVLVFFFSVTSAVDEAFSGGEMSAEQPASAGEDGAGQAELAGTQNVQDDMSTRANPHPLGTAITQGDWTVTVNSVTLDATPAVLAENQFNEPPAEGNQYLMVNLTATYNGDDPQGHTPWVDVEYVTVEGNTLNTYDHSAVTPDQFDSGSTLYTGASTTGNMVFEVPTATADEGTLAVTPDMFGDKAFVAVQ